MKFQEGRSIGSCKKHRLQIQICALIVSIAALVIGFITAPSMISSQTTPLPGVMASNNTTAGTVNANSAFLEKYTQPAIIEQSHRQLFLQEPW